MVSSIWIFATVAFQLVHLVFLKRPEAVALAAVKPQNFLLDPYHQLVSLLHLVDFQADRALVMILLCLIALHELLEAVRAGSRSAGRALDNGILFWNQLADGTLEVVWLERQSTVLIKIFGVKFYDKFG